MPEALFGGLVGGQLAVGEALLIGGVVERRRGEVGAVAYQVQSLAVAHRQIQRQRQRTRQPLHQRQGFAQRLLHGQLLILLQELAEQGEGELRQVEPLQQLLALRTEMTHQRAAQHRRGVAAVEQPQPLAGGQRLGRGGRARLAAVENPQRALQAAPEGRQVGVAGRGVGVEVVGGAAVGGLPAEAETAAGGLGGGGGEQLQQRRGTQRWPQVGE